MLNCEFKSCRCKSYHLPILNLYTELLKPITIKKEILLEEELELTFINYKVWYFVNIIGEKTLRYPFLTNLISNQMLLNLTITQWFTKKSNIEKVYFVAHKYFLSAGMVVATLKKPFKYLKKKLKIWTITARWYAQIFLLPTILWFENLYGYKFSLMKYMLKRKITFAHVFIKLFYLNFNIMQKPKKRIKRWIKKKYFSLECDLYRRF